LLGTSGSRKLTSCSETSASSRTTGLILVDKQGLPGKKVEYRSPPYRSITHSSVEAAGHVDLDAELKVWISGNPLPIQKRFNKQLNIYDVQSVPTGYVPEQPRRRAASKPARRR
jgi:PH (Pleckstrin Homology) domain-containing protein